MLIGSVAIKIFIPASASLKDKRRVVKSLITRLKNKFNVSVAEIDSLEEWQVSEIGIALVGNGTQILNKQISQVINFIEKEAEFQLIDIKTEIL
ncbi:MAG: hypothetical protein VR72_10275 [Clostridiaceae bacterium BRH_c20a]|nr:MAG: hypothetical protein VR72_10275 [Clostridiaceae bacterium BRH_c20a]